jgi:ribonuclease P protein component
MLKKTNRINTTRELQKVYRSGKTLHTPALVIKFAATPGTKSRVGLVVSKKISKKAVERNRIKRSVREQMRKILPELAVGDYMLVAKPAAANYLNKELISQLQAVLKKANLWQK